MEIAACCDSGTVCCATKEIYRAALLVSLSVASFPSIPQWLGIHTIYIYVRTATQNILRNVPQIFHAVLFRLQCDCRSSIQFGESVNHRIVFLGRLESGMLWNAIWVACTSASNEDPTAPVRVCGKRGFGSSNITAPAPLALCGIDR